MKIEFTHTQIRILCIFGVVFSAAMALFSADRLLQQNNPTLYMMIFGISLFFLMGIFFYLIDNKYVKLSSKTEEIVRIGKYDRIFRVFFFFFLILAIFSLSQSVYTKSLAYYSFISLSSLCIFLQIYKKGQVSKKFAITVLFSEIIPLSIIIRLSTWVVNPYLVGLDTVYHFRNIVSIIQEGYISSSFHFYFTYPFYYLSTAFTGLLSEFSVAIFNLNNLIISLVAILVIFCIGFEISNNYKVGLFSSLLLGIFTTSIFQYIFNTSKIGGTTLLLLCLYFLIKFSKKPNKTYLFLFWLSAISIFFWHPEVSLAMAILILAGSLFNYLTIKDSALMVKLSIYASIIYIISYVAYLDYANNLLFSHKFSNILFCIDLQPSLQISTFAQINFNQTFFIELFFSYVAFFIVMFFFAYVALKWIKEENPYGIYFIVLVVVFLSIPLFSVVSGNFSSNPERTLTYITLILIFFMAAGLNFILKIKGLKIAVVIIFFIFSFFSISSYLTGDANSVFSDEISIQTIYTSTQDIYSGKFLDKSKQNSIIYSYKSEVYTNYDEINGFSELQNRKIRKYDEKITPDSFIQINRPVLEKVNYLRKPWGNELESNMKSKNYLYDNGDVQIII